MERIKVEKEPHRDSEAGENKIDGIVTDHRLIRKGKPPAIVTMKILRVLFLNALETNNFWKESKQEDNKDRWFKTIATILWKISDPSIKLSMITCVQ